MNAKRGLGILFLLLATAGCSTLRQYTAPDEDNLLSGAGSIAVGKPASGGTATAKAFEQIDIDKLLATYGLNDPVVVSSHVNDDSYKYRRNDLQDRLIEASNQRCGAYLRTLASSKSQTQLGWGGLATFLSGAASVTTPAAVAKALAAGSTVSNGFLSLYNEAYFNNLAVNVVSGGIAKQREGILSNISPLRDYSLAKYPVNRAIADALLYHEKCNIIAGLEAAANATQQVESKKLAPALK